MMSPPQKEAADAARNLMFSLSPENLEAIKRSLAGEEETLKAAIATKEAEKAQREEVVKKRMAIYMSFASTQEELDILASMGISIADAGTNTEVTVPGSPIQPSPSLGPITVHPHTAGPAGLTAIFPGYSAKVRHTISGRRGRPILLRDNRVERGGRRV